jgi:hypothetical protein
LSHFAHQRVAFLRGVYEGWEEQLASDESDVYGIKFIENAYSSSLSPVPHIHTSLPFIL